MIAKPGYAGNGCKCLSSPLARPRTVATRIIAPTAQAHPLTDHDGWVRGARSDQSINKNEVEGRFPYKWQGPR